MVLIVEDHGLLADSLRFALESEGMAPRVLGPDDPAGIVAAAQDLRPAVTLLDLELGGAVGSGVSLIASLRQAGSVVVMLTGVTDRARLAECLEAGADGIIAKSAPFEVLLAGIRDAVELGSLTRPQQREELLAELRRQRAAEAARRAPFERLTARESQVLAGLVDGKAAERIAEEAFVSLATVRSQIRSILLKLGVNSQLAAVALARRNGWAG